MGNVASYPAPYLKFIKLFNEQKFFESHETLEDLWKRTEGELKLFYQGLIQAAVALHHLTKGNLYGAFYEFQASKEKLKRYPEKVEGLHLKFFLEAMDRTMQEFHQIPGFPKIELED